MRRFFLVMVLLLSAGGGVAWWLSTPGTLSAAEIATLEAHRPDPADGARVFHAAGCASCHTAPEATADASSGGDTRPILAGGRRLDSDFGTFVSPNISPDPTHGLGAWSLAEFAAAMRLGVDPDGQHYYPSFPYTAYSHMTAADISDLWAFLQTLPPSDRGNTPNEIAFPFSIRRGIGLWKWRYKTDDWVAAAPSETLDRGRYLVEALGHCAECHTPRDQFGGLVKARWMGGAPNPSGRGRIPNITPSALTWSADDIAYYLETGFTPDYDSAGGTMASVVRNLAQLPASDRDAIAAYIKGLAPVADLDG
ncbi:MAG: cytochrome c [Pseudomonadota bacterium]